MSTEIKMLQAADLGQAYDGSYYTISGAGGDLQEWITGIEDLLKEREIGKPKEWFQTTGDAINTYVLDRHPQNTDPYPAEITVLMFPLDGLDIGKLAVFKVGMQDRWFDDIITNMLKGF